MCFKGLGTRTGSAISKATQKVRKQWGNVVRPPGLFPGSTLTELCPPNQGSKPRKIRVICDRM